MALSVEYRTCDQEVVGSRLGRARGVKTLGMFLTPMCLCSPSSTSWYRPKDSDALQGRINTKLGLMLLPRQGPIFFSVFKTDQDPCDATTLYWLYKTPYSSMVQFEINIKLSTINGKGLNRMIARKETRNSAIAERPRCRVGA